MFEIKVLEKNTLCVCTRKEKRSTALNKMETERKRFATFLNLHAHKADVTSDPIAHVHFASMPTSHDAPLLQMTQEDLLEELDVNSELVRWLLEQMRTYDCTRQRIVALIFDKTTVLSEVLRLQPARVCMSK